MLYASHFERSNFEPSKKMKKHSLIILGLALYFVVPAFAQIKEETVDPQTKAQLDEFTKKFASALESNDAAQMAGVFAADAIYVTNKGPLHGQAEIQQYFADLFKGVHVDNHWAQVDANSVKFVGPDKVWRNGEWCNSVQLPNGDKKTVEGFWSAVEVRDGDTWKHQMLTVNLVPR
jgi:uncharacterized protein (TIGR02246 family)